MSTLPAAGAALEVKTSYHTYLLETLPDGHAFVSGHPRYCREPVEVELMRPLQPGCHLWFLHPTHGLVRTSRIEGIGEVSPTAGKPGKRAA